MTSDWRLFALASAVFAALTAIFGKLGVESLNSNLATFIRTVVILIFIGMLVTVRSEWNFSPTMNLKSVLFLVLSGLATGISWICYYRALQLGPASKVAPIDKLSVVLVVLFSFLFLGEAIGIKTIAGVFLIAAGSLLLLFK